MLRLTIFVYCLLLPFCSMAQIKLGWVKGVVKDQNNQPIDGASISILGSTKGTSTNSQGIFEIKIPAQKPVGILVSATGFEPMQQNVIPKWNTTTLLEFILTPKATKELTEVTVKDDRSRREAGKININPQQTLNLPTPVGGIEGMLKILVGSNNELSSQYSVRGGNYDENLIYVNEIEVFRPYLIRNGQQEGLSFINPEMANNVIFYNGGWPAKYGDKMSSVLDVSYRQPTKKSGSIIVGLLEQGLHIEGLNKPKSFTYNIGLRNRTNRGLFSAQEVQGSYIPSAADAQAFLTYQFNKKWSQELLINQSVTQFKLRPSFSQPSTAIFSPFYSGNVGLDIFFEGQERDKYNTNLWALSTLFQPNASSKWKFNLSYLNNRETENIDIGGAYLFGDRDFDKSNPTFGQIVNPLGSGFSQQYARNALNIKMLSIGLKGQQEKQHHFLQWGLQIDRQTVEDRIKEWQYEDSAGYNLPYNPGFIQLSSSIDTTNAFTAYRYSGFFQDNWRPNNSNSWTVHYGARFNYLSLNKEWLLSPRVNISYKPVVWKKDIVFRMATGLYHQPPFYREMRRFDGSLNTQLLAQKSWQVTGGADYLFQWNNRPFKLTAEAYYKQMWDVVPYDLDNVRLRYYGENNAKAYALGAEMRLTGEWVKDAESWLSIGLMRTRENLSNDHYYNYFNANGELITINSNDQVPADSVKQEIGWLRRPTDRLLTMGLFFQDYMSTNKHFKVYLSLLYGSNLPYSLPNTPRYRNALIIDPYLRADIGFSALLFDGNKKGRGSHHPLQKMQSIWANVEVFNLIDRPNTISYLFVKDFSNTTFSIPNRLTPRLLNIKLIARW